MEDKRDVKNKVWIYAVVLFTSAFIVLLLTAYSQIKLNNYLDNYKSQINTEESEKNKYQLSYTKALEVIDQLETENDGLKKENKQLSQSLSAARQESAEKEMNLTARQAETDKLIKAFNFYREGKTVFSAEVLITVKKELLPADSLKLYHEVYREITENAGRILFKEGYNHYINGNYQEALVKLNASRLITTTADYSARCLYYLGYAEHRTGNKERALEHMKQLVEEYPDSKYKSYAEAFIGGR